MSREFNRRGVFTFTGTGTSQGVPVITCKCEVCRSADPRDRRFRSSGYVSFEEGAFMIDIGPDFRMQCLNFDIHRLDGIFITHEHIDHVNGLDDVRPFNYLQGRMMPMYGESRVLKEIKRRNRYIFQPIAYFGLPQIELIRVKPYKIVDFKGLEVLPFRVMHGELPILGYAFGDMVYITDAKYVEVAAIEILKQAKTIVLNALHHRPHHTHFNLSEALDFISKHGLSNVYLTHISHQMGLYGEVSPSLPSGVHLAYDGLQLPFHY